MVGKAELLRFASLLYKVLIQSNLGEEKVCLTYRFIIMGGQDSNSRQGPGVRK